MEEEKIKTDWLQCKKAAHKFMEIQYRSKYFKKKIFWMDGLLVLEFIAITLISYFIIYSSMSWYWKLIIMIPWGIYSSLAIDNIIHYLNHWNLFKNNIGNIICRGIGVFSFNFVLEQKHHHFQHHKYNNTINDPLTTLKNADTHQTFYEFVIKDILHYFLDCLPMIKLPRYLKRIKKTNKIYFYEIICNRWACIIWLIILIIIDYKNTLLFFLPFIVALPPIITFTMSLTDHVPGNPNHVFKQATYYQPKSYLEKTISFLNHYSAATHLTHHLFPQVHWIFLVKLQNRLLKFYSKYNAPKSIVMNSFLIGNPFRLLFIVKEINRIRRINIV